VHRRLPLLCLALTPFVALVTPVTSFAATTKACRRCRLACQQVIPTCIQRDPRLAQCQPGKTRKCLRRAKRDCKRNVLECCHRACRETGTVVCCGSALSPTPTTTISMTTTSSTTAGGVTTTTVRGATTTTVPIRCTSDDQCPTCQCCRPDLNNTCGGPEAGGSCCNPATGPKTVFDHGVCGPHTPAVCPDKTQCSAPVGGNYFNCEGCPASGAIVWWCGPVEQSQPATPNSCMRTLTPPTGCP
jgi:hypothetical protein